MAEQGCSQPDEAPRVRLSFIVSAEFEDDGPLSPDAVKFYADRVRDALDYSDCGQADNFDVVPCGEEEVLDLIHRRGVDPDGGLDVKECPYGGGDRCRCGPCARCGAKKHSALHLPAWGEPVGSKPWGHRYATPSKEGSDLRNG
jgi:hypothetical protein